MIDTAAVMTTALSALANGACPIRSMTDGSKRPLGNWSEWQDHRPSLDQVQNWFQGGHPGLGIVCGEISGRLECLEIEGRAMRPLWIPLKERMQQAGLLDLLIRISAGYAEKSPSGGVHFLYRIDGESEMPGNTKLASRVIPGVVQIESMIETRGEGGFIVVAPSNGPTHPTGEPWVMLSGGWDTVCTITREQRDALIRICESFDEMPPMVVPPAPRVVTKPTAGGSGWVDAALAEWNQANPIEAVLQHHGWSYLESDGLGQLWRRPGKNRGSCSARVNLNNRLHVFSTSTPFVAGQRRATTYDSLDVELTYRLGRPPSSDERVALLRAETTAAPPTDDWSFVGRAAGTAGVQHHQEGVVESVANIADEFWTARSYLGQIRDAAHSGLLGPDALLGATLARYATTIPPTLMLPRIVGALATFDYTSMLVGPTGSGKSTTMACAAELMGNYPPNDRILFDPPIGSGEGLVQAFLQLEKIDVDGKEMQVQRQILDGVHLAVDEGTVLSAQMKREGTVIAQTLCSAWVGAPLGQLNASSSTKRLIGRYEARITAVMGIQTERGEYLLTGLAAEMGLPQRMVYFSLVDPAMPSPGSVAWPGELDVHYLDPHSWSIRHPVKVHPQIVAEIQSHQHGVGTGRTLVETLDSHRFLAQLKTAGLLMFMDERREVTIEDWELARLVIDASRRVRNTILEAATMSRRKVSETRVLARVGESLAIEDATRARAVDRGARAMAKRVARAEEPVVRRDLHNAAASRDRKVASFEEMVEYAIDRGWVVDNFDGLNHIFTPGDSKPV